MKALCYADYSLLKITDEPLPIPGDGEVLVRVAAAAICGSELDAFRSRSPRRKPPLILGHEFCGVVEHLGPGVDSIGVGSRIVSNAIIACGACPQCTEGNSHLCVDRKLFGMHRPGAFAEFVTVPQECAIDWPVSLPAEAACLAEPLANGIHMADLTSHLPAASILVIGAGPIGLMAQQAFQVLRGSRVIASDLSPERLAVAQSLGAVQAEDARTGDLVSACKEQTHGRGVDLVIDAVGSAQTKKLSTEIVRPGGAAVWIGLHDDSVNINSYALTLMERQVVGTYGCTLDQLKRAVALLDDGKVVVEPWIKRFALSESVSAFERMLAAQGDDIKAVIMPDS